MAPPPPPTAAASSSSSPAAPQAHQAAHAEARAQVKVQEAQSKSPPASVSVSAKHRHKPVARTSSSSSTAMCCTPPPPSTDDDINNTNGGKQQLKPMKQRRASSQENRYRRNRYHLLASNHRLPTDPDTQSDYLYSVLANPRRSSTSLFQRQGTSNHQRRRSPPSMTSEETKLHETKLELLRELGKSGGDTTTSVFRDALGHLASLYGLDGDGDGDGEGEGGCRWDARDDPVLSRSYHGDDGSTPPTNPVDASGPALEGTWLALSRPQFPGCLGRNEYGEYVYTLGRMSFEMFRPTELVCSIQGTFNRVEVLRRDEGEARRGLLQDLPKSLRGEVKRGRSILRTYTIITAFTIEPRTSCMVVKKADNDPSQSSSSSSSHPNGAVRQPIKGIMTTRGYVLPDPKRPHRLSVWFDGGTIEVNDDFDLDEWKAILGDANSSGGGIEAQAAASPGDSSSSKKKGTGKSSSSSGISSGGGGGSKKATAAKAKAAAKASSRRRISGRAKIFAARLLLGAAPPEDTGGMSDEDGTVRYRLHRPLGGHGKTFVDVLYLDGGMRIMRGNMGSVYVFVRVPED